MKTLTTIGFSLFAILFTLQSVAYLWERGHPSQCYVNRLRMNHVDLKVFAQQAGTLMRADPWFRAACNPTTSDSYCAVALLTLGHSTQMDEAIQHAKETLVTEGMRVRKEFILPGEREYDCIENLRLRSFEFFHTPFQTLEPLLKQLPDWNRIQSNQVWILNDDAFALLKKSVPSSAVEIFKRVSLKTLTEGHFDVIYWHFLLRRFFERGASDAHLHRTLLVGDEKRPARWFLAAHLTEVIEPSEKEIDRCVRERHDLMPIERRDAYLRIFVEKQISQARVEGCDIDQNDNSH